MPRVVTRTKNRAGRDYTCGKCGRTIHPGEQYRWWAFRYGGKRYRCWRPECSPKASDLTQSKLGEVYRAMEDAEEQLGSATNAQDIEGIMAAAGETIQTVAEEYQEAAQAFGEAGENQERYEELEPFAEEVSGFEPSDEIEEEVECQECEGMGFTQGEEKEDGSVEEEKCDTCHGEGKVANEELDDQLEAARDEAREVLSNMPL